MTTSEWVVECFKVKKETDHTLLFGVALLVLLIVTIMLLLICPVSAWAFETEASYYTKASCLREGTSGIMANGKGLDDEAFTAASWDYEFGQRLRVTFNGRSVVVSVTDRGPSKRLYKKGRRLDLSKAAFERLAPLGKGIIKVQVTEIN